ncbi:MAG: hypothetical protein ACXWC9_08760, partial [Pseudobdellovibrionaceae bacterium]
MRKKIIRIFIAVSILGLTFAAYTNCAPSQKYNSDSKSESKMDLSSNSIDLSEKIEVSGSGITRDISSGCPAFDFNDFI